MSHWGNWRCVSLFVHVKIKKYNFWEINIFQIITLLIVTLIKCQNANFMSWWTTWKHCHYFEEKYLWIIHLTLVCSWWLHSHVFCSIAFYICSCMCCLCCTSVPTYMLNWLINLESWNLKRSPLVDFEKKSRWTEAATKGNIVCPYQSL